MAGGADGRRRTAPRRHFSRRVTFRHNDSAFLVAWAEPPCRNRVFFPGRNPDNARGGWMENFESAPSFGITAELVAGDSWVSRGSHRLVHCREMAAAFRADAHIR